MERLNALIEFERAVLALDKLHRTHTVDRNAKWKLELRRIQAIYRTRRKAILEP